MNILVPKSELQDLHLRVDQIEHKIDIILDHAQEHSEELHGVRDQLKEHTSVLHDIAHGFQYKIRRQEKMIIVGSCVILVLMFWIVSKI